MSNGEIWVGRIDYNIKRGGWVIACSLFSLSTGAIRLRLDDSCHFLLFLVSTISATVIWDRSEAGTKVERVQQTPHGRY